MKTRGIVGFFQTLASDCFSPHCLEFIPIFKGWKKEILSLLWTNLDPWYKPEESQLLAQSDHHELSNLVVDGCLS